VPEKPSVHTNEVSNNPGMNTQNELLEDLLTERRAGQHIEGIEALTDDELRHLVLLSRVLANPEDNHRLAKWFMGVLDNEMRIRKSDGKMERGYVPFPAEEYSNDELYDCALRLDFLRDFSTLSQAEKAFVVNLHRTVQMYLSIRNNVHTSDMELICPQEAARLLGVERSDTLRLARKGILPKPYKLSPRVYRWRRCDIIAAIERLK
jgi:predicted DNA-binding transcriptional regulator AlpA